MNSTPTETTGTISDFENGHDSRIPWRMLILATRVTQSKAICQKAGSALPLLLSYVRRTDAAGFVDGVFYSELAEELGVSLSAVKKWTAHLKQEKLVIQASQGRNGIRVEIPLPEADGCPVDSIRYLLIELSRRLNSFEHSVEAGFSQAHRYLDTLVGDLAP